MTLMWHCIGLVELLGKRQEKRSAADILMSYSLGLLPPDVGNGDDIHSDIFGLVLFHSRDLLRYFMGSHC